MPNNNKSDLPKIHLEKADMVWSLKDSSPHLWEAFLNYSPEAKSLIASFDNLQQVPVCSSLEPSSNSIWARPRNSRRAFYLKSNSQGVLAVKGSEIKCLDLMTEFKATAEFRASGRPWKLFDFFLLREQKLPYAVSLQEALQESQASLRYQSAHFEEFKTFAMAPIPLAVFQWSDLDEKKYYDTAKGFLNARTDDLAQLLLKNRGLGAYIYYYPHLPNRISFFAPEAAESYEQRLKSLASSEDSEKQCDALVAVDTLLEQVAKMLALGFFPFGLDSYGVGQCIAPQNVTLKGGIVDLDSMIPFQVIGHDREFHEVFFSMLVVLTATVRAFLIAPLPYVEFEYTDPSTISTVVTNYVWEKLRHHYSLLNVGHQQDLRINSLLQKDSALNLEGILKNLFPSKPLHSRTKHLGIYEKGGPRHHGL